MKGRGLNPHIYGSNVEQQRYAPGDEDNAGQLSDPRTRRQKLLDENVESKSDDPVEIHDAAVEQQGHEKPATTQAKGSVYQAHPERTGSPRPPVR